MHVRASRAEEHGGASHLPQSLPSSAEKVLVGLALTKGRVQAASPHPPLDEAEPGKRPDDQDAGSSPALYKERA